MTHISQGLAFGAMQFGTTADMRAAEAMVGACLDAGELFCRGRGAAHVVGRPAALQRGDVAGQVFSGGADDVHERKEVRSRRSLRMLDAGGQAPPPSQAARSAICWSLASVTGSPWWSCRTSRRPSRKVSGPEKVTRCVTLTASP